MSEPIGPIEGRIRSIMSKGIPVPGHTNMVRGVDPVIQEAFVALAREIDNLNLKLSGLPSDITGYQSMADRLQTSEESRLEWESKCKAAEAEVDRLKGFKDYVHGYLDGLEIPHGDPNNVHQQQGCRIGARLDMLAARLQSNAK